MAWQNEGQMLFSVKKRWIIQENDGGECVDREEANNGEKDAKGLGPHFHGSQRNAVGAPTSPIRHRVNLLYNLLPNTWYDRFKCVFLLGLQH